MLVRIAAALLAVGLLSGTALAEPAPAKPAKQQRTVLRRAERRDRERSAALKRGERIVQIDTVVVQGRSQRPQAAVEVSVQSFQFPVGTARYSDFDRRKLKSSSDDRW